MASEQEQTNPAQNPITADEPRITISGPATDASRSIPLAGGDPLPAWVGVADLLLMGLVLILSFLLGSFLAQNSDLWMHLATGRMIAQGTHQFGVDPFSVGSSGPWINHSWLYDWLSYLLYESFGGPSLVVLKATGVSVLALALLRARHPGTSRWLQTVCVLLGVLALSPRLVLQPTVVSFVFLGVTMFVLSRAGVFRLSDDDGDSDAKLLWALPPLFAVWVNLDNYFILGPLTVGLAWLGLGVQRLLKIETPTCGKRLGAVFGIGLLACLLNPFHVQAFVLPGELAFIPVRLASLVGLTLPETIFAGGRTLQTLQQYDSQFTTTRSSLTGWYLTNPYLGFNVAGLSFLLLLLLGLATFVLSALTSQAVGAPALHAGRFIVWIFFAVLAVSQHRLLPFFAIVAAPLTAMTLGELGAWFTRPKVQNTAPPAVGGARLARVLSFVVMLVLLAFAWPGWINSTIDFGSQRRVAWDVLPDGSLKKTAESLAELKQTEQCGNVFNTQIDVANYCAWFAPDVRCVFDQRYPLFSGSAETYAKAKAALLDKEKPSSDWSALFIDKKIDHVVLSNFLYVQDFPSWWLAPRWLQRFGDAKQAVFAWSGPKQRWPAGKMGQEWNALAFGKVRADERAPLHGPLPPQEVPGFFDEYLEGTGPLPQPAQEVDLKLAYFQVMSERSKVPFEYSMLLVPATMAPLTGLAGPLVQASHLTNSWRATLLFQIVQDPNSRRGFYHVPDAGPVAAPLLAVRLARQAVADSPGNDRCYRRLVDAYQTLHNVQESHWAGQAGPAPLRNQLRRLQVVTGLRTAVLLRPDDWQLQIFLADFYSRQHYLDLALEHFVEAEKRLAEQQPNSTMMLDALRAQKQKIEDQRKLFEVDVDRRRADYELKAATAKGLAKYRLAMHSPYKLIDKKNQEAVDREGRGLALVALKVVQELPLETLDLAERYEVGVAQIDLLLNMGRAREVAEELPALKEFLGPSYDQFQLLTAGALGRYDEMIGPLENMEKAAASRLHNNFGQAFSFGHFHQPGLLGDSYAPLAHPVPMLYYQAVQQWNEATQHLFDLRTLRGATALERGDTDLAYRILSDTLREANLANFPDRTLAERYLHHLKQQR